MYINSSLGSFGNYYTYHLYDTFLSEQKEVTAENVDSLRLASLLNKNTKNIVLQQLTINEYLKSKFSNNDVESYKKHQVIFDSIYKGSFFEKMHASKIEEIKELVDNPVLSEKTEILSFKTQDSKKYLDEIIAGSKGKVIYIDHWATWCGPCKSEFKNSTPQLKEKFKDQIEFVYFCYQSPEKNWKPTISKFKVEGKHYFIEKGKGADLFQQISLKGFPTYTIINKKGEIVHSNFDYRPSNPETSIILKQLIAEN